MFSPAAAAPESCKCLEEVEFVVVLLRGVLGPERERSCCPSPGRQDGSPLLRLPEACLDGLYLVWHAHKILGKGKRSLRPFNAEVEGERRPGFVVPKGKRFFSCLQVLQSQ